MKVIYRFVFNRKNCLNRQGTALIQLEAYLNGHKKYFSTHIYVKPEQWNSTLSLIRKHPHAEQLNLMLYQFKMQLEKKELDLWQQGKPVTLNLLKKVMCTNHSSDFLLFFEQEVSHASIRESTKKNHLTTLQHLKKFRAEVPFQHLTFDFIIDFEYYLMQKNFHGNTIAKHMTQLKKYVHLAILKNYLSDRQDPFLFYKLKYLPTRHTFLTPDELHKLEQMSGLLSNTKQQQILDAFLFCCYTGLRYSDFIQLSNHNLINISNNYWLIYQSVKTQVEVRIPLYLLFHGKPVSILNKYIKNLSYFFQLKDNSNINKILKKIALQANLQKSISFHTARHTNATLLIYNGADITTVQKILGHKSIKTTQIYAEIMDETLVKDLKKSFG